MRIEHRVSRILRLCACLLPTLLAGCPGTLDDKERFVVDAGSDSNDTSGCGDVPSRIFVPSCGTNGCHGATAPQQGLDLVSPGLDTRLVGVQAKTCSGILADPQNPAGSLLYTKLLAQPSCGARMPLAREPLSDADTACVLGWIAAQ